MANRTARLHGFGEIAALLDNQHYDHRVPCSAASANRLGLVRSALERDRLATARGARSHRSTGRLCLHRRRRALAAMNARATRPLGQPTRGKTARNRLRRVDNFVTQYDPALLRRRDADFHHAWFVDVGYGAEPWTTLESAARLRALTPDLPVLGVEIDPERVAAAQPYADENTCFRLGGFNLPLQRHADGQPERVRLIRAFNVLRQYQAHEVAQAWAALGDTLLPGGLLIEGTSEPFGRIWVANLLRRHATALHYEALVFSTNFRLGFDPADFQAVLPKQFIHRMTPGEDIYRLMQTWKAAARATVALRAWSTRQWFRAAAEELAAQGYAVDCRTRWLNNGYLLVRAGAEGRLVARGYS